MSQANGFHGASGRPANRLPDHDVWPANVEAEESVIGAVLMDPSALHEIAGFLTPEHFWRSSLAEAWRTILELYADGTPIDGVSVSEAMGRAGTLDDVGGVLGLAALMERVPSAANIRHYAGIVKEKWFAREYKAYGRMIAAKAESHDHTSEDLTEAAQSELFRIVGSQGSNRTLSLQSVFDRSADRFVSRQPGVSGMRSGLPGLDMLTDGFKPGELTILAARPSIGKTAIALNILSHMAIVGREPTLFISLEMMNDEIGNRLVISRSGVSNQRSMGADGLSASEIAAIDRARAEVRGAPALVDDSPSINVLGIMALARRWIARVGVRMVIVDYLQLVRGDGSNREQEISSISRGLKMIARECKVSVLCLAQLNRQVETREDKRPRLSDLRESGAIEQDADVVLLMHRPDYYRADDRPGYCEVIVAKNRNGPTGSAEFHFDRTLGLFTTWEAPTFDEATAEF